MKPLYVIWLIIAAMFAIKWLPRFYNIYECPPYYPVDQGCGVVQPAGGGVNYCYWLYHLDFYGFFKIRYCWPYWCHFKCESIVVDEEHVIHY